MTAKISWRYSIKSDLRLLAEWNHQLIQDEGHRNPMTVQQLSERMKKWLKGEYQAVVFEREKPVGYALYKEEEDSIYLRQFFIAREQRRKGIGSAAFSILREKVWPTNRRLTVDVLCHNQAAVTFWREAGFRDYSLSMEIVPDNR